MKYHRAASTERMGAWGDGRVALARDSVSIALSECAAAIERETSRRAMVDLNPEHWTDVTATVRDYTKAARANGDQVQAVIKTLMELVRDSNVGHGDLARLSTDTAQVCIDAYFELPPTVHAPAPTPVLAFRRS